MADLGKNAYVKQLLIFLSNQDYQSSLGFGKEFVEKFPAEMISHYLLAKVLYFNKDFAGSAMEGRKSFNLASDPDDILACAITTSTAYYELKEYAKGYELLNSVQKSTEGSGDAPVRVRIGPERRECRPEARSEAVCSEQEERGSPDAEDDRVSRIQ